MAITGTSATRRELYLAQQKVRKAVARGITKTLTEIKATVVAESRRVFNNPTSYTLNAWRMQAAESNGLTGLVELKKDPQYSKHPLTPQVVGGTRHTKRFERSLVAKGAMLPGWFAVPLRAAKGSDGKVTRGLLQQVLAQATIAQKTGGGLGVPDRSKKTLRRQLQARGRAGGQFIFLKVGKGKLKPGIYLLRGEYFGKNGGYRRGSELVPLFRYVTSVNYIVRLPFDEISRRIAGQRLQQNIESSINGANLLR